MTNREEQEEKLRVILNDVKRDRPDTMHSRTDTDAPGGRYSSLGKPFVTGATPGPQYPKISSGAWSEGIDQLTGTEPPLGFDVNEMEPVGTTAEIERSATSARELPITEARTLGRGSAYAPSPTIRETSAPGGGATNQPTFRRRI
jgi:hypothetical protein